MQARRVWIGLAVLISVGFTIAGFWNSSDEDPNRARDDSSVLPESLLPENSLESDLSDEADVPLEPEEPATRELTVAGGQSVKLTVVERVKLLVPPYGAVFNDLRQRAEEGDTDAQYQLGKLLYECRYVPENESDLAAEIDSLYQTRRRHGWDIRDPEQEARSMRQGYENCRGVPASVRGDYRQWMRRAADAGLLEAQLNLMFHLPRGEYCQYIEECSADQVELMESLRAEAREQVGSALEAGSVEALRLVGSWALNDEMGLVDPIAAYAHLSAYDRIQAASGHEREVQGLLESVRKRLRPVDIEQAEADAADLLSAPNCCIWIQ